MATDNPGKISSLLNQDGSCTTCGKSAFGCCVTCFLCLQKFHAVGCSVDSNICTQTFLNAYTPLSDKTGVNETRPGNFKFICNICITDFEIKRAKSSSDKLNCLETRVGRIDESLDALKKDIKTLLLHTKDEGGFDSHSTSHQPSAWGVIQTPPTIDYVTPSNSSESEFLPKVADVPKSILIIDNNGDSKRSTIDTVEKVVIDCNIRIKNSYDNKKGDTVVICDSDEQRDLLQEKIKEALPTVSAKTLDNRLNKTIAVVGFSSTYTESNLLDTILKQNEFVNDFINFKSQGLSEKHIKLLHVKPLKNNPQLFQGVFKISTLLRDLLKKFNDKLLVGIRNVTIFDRIFVKRCFGCQKYGHIHANCPTPNVIKCANCGASHETRSCKAANEQHKCVNCLMHGTSNSNHAASSTNCPVFQTELNRLKDLN